VTIRGEAGAVGPDGAVIRPARLLVQFEAAGAHRWAWLRQCGDVQAAAGCLDCCCGQSLSCAAGWGASNPPCHAVLKTAGSRAMAASRP
jgi:hypothetical protein